MGMHRFLFSGSHCLGPAAPGLDHLKLLRPTFHNANKYSAYECGITATTEAREKFSVRYYLVAVMFLVFDVETVFLMPWAIQMKELAVFGLIEMGIFLFLLLFGYGYIWTKGALTWE